MLLMCGHCWHPRTAIGFHELSVVVNKCIGLAMILHALSIFPHPVSAKKKWFLNNSHLLVLGFSLF